MNKNRSLFLLLITSIILSGCRKLTTGAPAPNFSRPGANTDVLNIKNATADSINITPYLEIYTGDAQIPDTISSQKNLWQKCGDSLSPAAFSQTGTFWFRFTLQNNSPLVFRRLLCFNDFDYIALDYFSPTVQRAGNVVPIKNWSYPADNYCLVLSINATQTRTFYLCCNNENNGSRRPIYFIMRTEQNEGNHEAFEIRKRMTDTVFLFFYLGFLFFCFIYFLAQFFYRKNEKALFIYSLYILFTLLYSFRDIDKHYFLQTAFPLFNGINIWGEAIFSYLSYIFYLLFIVYLLDLKKERKSAFHFIVSAIGLISVLLVADLVLRLSGNLQPAMSLFVKSRMLLFPFTILCFILMLPLKGSYYKYFLLGLAFLVLGTGINLLVFLLRNYPGFLFHESISSMYGFWGNTVNYTRLGVLTEVLFFSLGLAKKMRVEFATAILEQDTAIENRFHTHEVKSGLLTLKSKLDVESDAARYLNIYRDYLLKALVIMKSKTGIELIREIEMAGAYFKLRNEEDDRFEFIFANNTGIDMNGILIPAGLLIPFIQNFFDHAVSGDSDKYQFELLLYLERNKINLDISDNGKGVDMVTVFNKAGSSGLDIARRKINLYNTLAGSKIDFTIGNKKTSAGTLIKITNLPKKSQHDKSHPG